MRGGHIPSQIPNPFIPSSYSSSGRGGGPGRGNFPPAYPNGGFYDSEFPNVPPDRHGLPMSGGRLGHGRGGYEGSRYPSYDSNPYGGSSFSADERSRRSEGSSDNSPSVWGPALQGGIQAALPALCSMLSTAFKNDDDSRPMNRRNSDDKRKRELEQKEHQHRQEMKEMTEKWNKTEEERRKERMEAKKQEKILQQKIEGQNESIEKMKADFNEAQKNTAEQLQKHKKEHSDAVKEIQENHSKELQKRDEENQKLKQDLAALMQQFKALQLEFINSFHGKPKHKFPTDSKEMTELLKKAKEKLHLDTENFINIAFMGRVNTGKSSLINGLLGLDDDHPKAAPVGYLETTKEITLYEFLDERLKNLRLYDVPGSATLDHKSETYFWDKCLYAFDLLIVCTYGVLTCEEIDFALDALKFKQPIVFVRSQCDIVLDNAKKSRKIRQIDQDAVCKHIDELSKSFIADIKKTGNKELLKVPCFFVSAHTLRDLRQNENPEAVYEEEYFLQYIMEQSHNDRHREF